MIIEDTLITTSTMAEEQTPIKQETFDEAHESLAASLTPRDVSRDYEIRCLEVQLETLKRTLSDDSSPFHNMPTFTPSTLTFPNELHEMIRDIENDGWETAIEGGLTHQMMEEAITTAQALKKKRDERDKARLSEIMKTKQLSPSPYARFNNLARLIDGKQSDGGQMSISPAAVDETKFENPTAKDWDKLAPQTLPSDQQRIVNQANSRPTIPTKLQIEAASKLLTGYINRENPRALNFLRADFARTAQSGLQSNIEVLGMSSIESKHASGDISTRGDEGQNPELCSGQAARETQSLSSRDEGLQDTGMRATILSDEEAAERKKAAEHVLIHGELNFGIGSIVNSNGVRCIRMSHETALLIAERRSFQKLYLAALISALELEKKKVDGLLPDAEIDLLLETARSWEIKPTNNIEFLYNPSPFSVFLSANAGMNDGTNLEAKIRSCTQDIQQLGFFTNAGTFLGECVLRKQESYKEFWVRMRKAQAALAEFPPPPGINLEELGFIVEKDGTPRLFKGKFTNFKFLQEVRHRRSAEAAVMQIIPDELIERAAQGNVSADEINEILEKLKAAKIDGRPPKSARNSREVNGSPLDQTHGHLSLQERKQQQRRGRGAESDNPNGRARSNSPDRKLGFYKSHVESLQGNLARYPSIAEVIQRITKSELKGATIFVEDDQGNVVIPLKFTTGNRSDKLGPALNGKLSEKAFAGFQLLRDICFGGVPDGKGNRLLTPTGEKYRIECNSTWRTNRLTESNPNSSNSGQRTHKGGRGGGGGGGHNARANASVGASVLADDDDTPPLRNANGRFDP